MRKTTLLTFFMLCLTAVAMALPVDLSQAKSIARQYVKRNGLGHGAPQAMELQLVGVRTVQTAATSGEDYPAYYVFNKGNESGFVIVSGDDRMRPVIGETFSGSFDAAEVNPNFQWWLDAVAQSAEHLAVSDDESLLYSESESTAVVEPLIQTQWGQDAPYNNLCPEINGSRSVTGCVATAMAQVFYYLRYPTTGTGTVNYSWTTTIDKDTYTNKIDDNLSNYSFDYSLMTPTYESTDEGDAADAVAKLMYACGIASEMNYSPEGSGSNVKYAVLTGNFSLDKSCKYASRALYTTDEWHALLKSELDANRPMLYSGHSNEYGGHQFICDGYDSDGKFHFNWGWSGSQDGFYDVDAIVFSETQDVVYNMKKDEGGIEDPTDCSYMWCGTMGIKGQTLPYSVELGKEFCPAVNDFYNMWKEHTCYLGAALYNASGSVQTYVAPYDLPAGSYGTIYDTSYTLSTDIKAGTYALCPVYCYSTDNLHFLKNSVATDGARYLIVTVKDGKATFIDSRKTISSSSSLASFSSPCNVKVPEGVAVYKAKMSDDGSNVVLTEVETDVIPANMGVIVYYEGGRTFSFDITEETCEDGFSDNELIATTTNPTVPSSGTYYGLKANAAEFAQLKGGLELSSNKAYIMASSDNGAKSISITYSDGTTSGISEMHTEANPADNAYYTLQGLRVEKPTKGLYIHQGHKIIIK